MKGKQSKIDSLNGELTSYKIVNTILLQEIEDNTKNSALESQIV